MAAIGTVRHHAFKPQSEKPRIAKPEPLGDVRHPLWPPKVEPVYGIDRALTGKQRRQLKAAAEREGAP